MRVMIVDDEPAILRSIVSLTTELKPQWEIDSCLNAIDAKEKLQSKHYDLLLTDINMPVTNGLDLAEWVKEQRFNTHIVMISGYSDFDYARNAMRLGIQDYVLKPVEELPYLHLLNAIEENKKIKDELRRKNLIKNHLVSLPEECELLSDENPSSVAQADFANNRYLLLVATYAACTKDWDEAEYTKLEKLSELKLEHRIAMMLEVSEDCWQFDSLYGSVTIIVTFSAHHAQRRSQELLDGLVLWVKKVEALNIISAGLYSLTSELTQRQKKILSTLNRFAGLDGGNLFELNAVMPELKPELLHSLRKQYQSFWENMVEQNDTVFCLRWQNIVNIWAENKLRQEQCQLEIDRFCHAAELIIRSSESRTVLSILAPTLKADLATVSSWSNFIKCSEQSIKDFLDDLHKLQAKVSDRHSSTVHELRLFLDENYRENTSMKTLAPRYGYTPSYLSNIFKEHLGLSPVDYMNQLRMKEAAYLLANKHEMTNAEIAAYLGYTDASYFSRVFKKICGTAPSAFRKNK